MDTEHTFENAVGQVVRLETLDFIVPKGKLFFTSQVQVWTARRQLITNGQQTQHK